MYCKFFSRGCDHKMNKVKKLPMFGLASVSTVLTCIQLVIVATPSPYPSLVIPLSPVTVYSGVYFEYRIPDDTFTDVQDENLSLQLLTHNNQV